jgi:hypothetical protein
VDEVGLALKRWGEVERIRELEGGHRNRAVLIRCAGELAVAKTTRRTERSLHWVEEVPLCAAASPVLLVRRLDLDGPRRGRRPRALPADV